MRRVILLLITAFSLLLCAGVLRAQVGVELLENGGFGQSGLYVKPQKWYVNTVLQQSKSSEPHSGSFALKLYMGASDAQITVYQWPTGKAINCIPVTPGAEYELTYWYKGMGSRKNIIPTVVWYKGDTKVGDDDKRYSEIVTLTNTWQEKKVKFVAPDADLCGVGFTFYEKHGDYVILDDVSFKMTDAGSGVVPLTPPSGIKYNAYQREIDLSWGSVGTEGVEYKVFMNDALLGTTQETSYTVTGLDLATNYKFKFQTVKGTKSSPLSEEKTIRTETLSRLENDESRIPYLYRMKDYGYIDRTLLLHWYDLAKKDANIKYWIDGKEVTPVDDKLTFPKAGVQRLRIEIVESPTQRWNIEYNLHVK
jgi:putative chitinase